MDIVMKGDSHYQHGGMPIVDLERLGLKERPVLDFSVNLNHLGPPEIVRENWPGFLEVLERYPSVEGEGIASYYSDRFNIPRDNVLAGNGSTELIYLLPRVFRFKKVMVMSPSYHDYERACLLSGAEVRRHSLSPEEDFSFPAMSRLMALLRDVDAVWIGRPNNPTGTLFPKDLLLELASRLPDRYFIVDEAFIQFVDRWEEESLLTGTPTANILVIHSLTKFYALAGIRLGGLVGSTESIARLKKAKEPWTVNAIADRVAGLLTQCRDYDQRTRTEVSRERERVFDRLKRLDGMIPFPPRANFILCQWLKSGDLDDLLRHLLSEGLYVRDCRNFPGLEKNFFRIGLRSGKENDRLLSVLSAL